MSGVGTELGGNEALHSNGDCGINEESLLSSGESTEGGNDGILTLQSRFQGFERPEVDIDRFDRGGEFGFAFRTSENRDIEVGLA